MRSSKVGAFVMAAMVVSLPVRLAAQYEHTRALAPLPVSDVSCRIVPVNAKNKKKSELAKTVMLIGKYPARVVTVGLDSANRVLDFHSGLGWFYPARGDEGVDVWFARDGRIVRSSRDTRADGAKNSVRTALTAGDLEIVNHMVRDVLNRCRS
jgi:hypothetical protein